MYGIAARSARGFGCLRLARNDDRAHIQNYFKRGEISILVTFKSRATGQFSTLDNEAVRLIKMMGRSGTVPGALSADEVSAALKQLKVAIAAEKEAEEAEEVEEKEDDKEPRVNISVHVYPLIEMLAAAVRENCEVMWYQ